MNKKKRVNLISFTIQNQIKLLFLSLRISNGQMNVMIKKIRTKRLMMVYTGDMLTQTLFKIKKTKTNFSCLNKFNAASAHFIVKINANVLIQILKFKI